MCRVSRPGARFWGFLLLFFGALPVGAPGALRVKIWQDKAQSPVFRSNGIVLGSNHLTWGGNVFPFAKGVAAIQTTKALHFGAGHFTGNFQFQKVGHEIRVVNLVEMEAYLPGVLQGEISASWPVEAQKAQAVAARSFALVSQLRSSNQAYDLDGTPLSQVFLGTVSCPEESRLAVKATRGEVVTYKGHPVLAYFHAHCGGQTEAAEAVWPGSEEPLGYLKSVASPWAKEAPGYAWQTNLSRRELAKAFTNGKGQGATNWHVKEWTPSHRVGAVILEFPDGKKIIEGNVFRLAVGALRLPSLLFTVRPERGGWFLEGHGFGHGVGLCQWSAHIMAKKGYGYRQILSTFYPGAKVAVMP